MNFLKSLLNFEQVNSFFNPFPINNRKFPQKDPAKVLYQSIDWNKSIIGGSYALKQFTGDSWIPDDIDIFIGCHTDAEFDEAAKRFQESSGADLIKFSARTHNNELVWTDVKKDQTEVSHYKIDNREEAFNDFIRGTKTFKLDAIPEHKIQLINIKLDGTEPTPLALESIMSRITDVPSCVSYRIDKPKGAGSLPKGQDCLSETKTSFATKIFQVPEKGMECIMTGKCNSKDVCPSRVSKYTARGYQFKG